MYGTQTFFEISLPFLLFENDVEMYGTQTGPTGPQGKQGFENDVEMYGTQTIENDLVCIQ